MHASGSINEQPVTIPAGAVSLEGNLAIPPEARGVVLFAHGSGSSRHSPRNRYVAGELYKEGLASLLMDLLTSEEETEDMFTARLRFDIPLLAGRLVAATDWISANPLTSSMKIGYFGASTGAAAALIAAAERSDQVGAVVSRGGRPDLAAPVLGRVTAPTLLIVGGEDDVVIGMNKDAASMMKAEHEMRIIPGATHLFEEPGTLEEAARLAAVWFRQYLGGETPASGGAGLKNVAG